MRTVCRQGRRDAYVKVESSKEEMAMTSTGNSANTLADRTDHAFVAFYHTLVSVVQGVVFGYLIFHLAETFKGTVTVYDLLIHSIAFCFVVAATFGYLIATLVFWWPVTVLDIIVIFALGFGQVLPLASSASVVGWWWGMAGLTACGIVAYLHSIRQMARSLHRDDLPKDAIKAADESLRLAIGTCAAIYMMSVVLAVVQPAKHKELFLALLLLAVVWLIGMKQTYLARIYKAGGVRR
jgi:hypothetical protein